MDLRDWATPTGVTRVTRLAPTAGTPARGCGGGVASATGGCCWLPLLAMVERRSATPIRM